MASGTARAAWADLDSTGGSELRGRGGVRPRLRPGSPPTGGGRDWVVICDVGIIPYRVGGLVDYAHPKQRYEYLAAGKPVVATPMPAPMELAAPSWLASGAPAFVAGIEEALVSARCPAARAQRRDVAVRNSWSARGEQLRGLLAGLEDAR